MSTISETYNRTQVFFTGFFNAWYVYSEGELFASR